MAKQGFHPFTFVVCSTILVLVNPLCSTAYEDRKVYIVYMGSLPEGAYSPAHDHMTILQEVVNPISASNHLVRSYKRSFNGFAANLTDSEAKKLYDMKQVISVFPSISYKLQTTRSWDFMGLNERSIRRTSVESDTVIGVIDSGIWPESESFSDKGYSPPPQKWKGACKGGQNFTCNNKLVGARFYHGNSARDELGHGTHTASTAAGNEVIGASFYGLGKGTARGGVPSARIAVYNVCLVLFCPGDGILAAFDDAIADGVDIITISIGSGNVIPYENDPIAIGSFHAMKNGILTVQAGGNDGHLKSTASVSPWILTVAASSIDRKFITKLVLSNGSTIVGNSINSFKSMIHDATFVYGKDAAKDPSVADLARQCAGGSLDKTKVKGKIVLCDRAGGASEAFYSGSAGAILMESLQSANVSSVTPLPALRINNDTYAKVISYLNNTNEPKGHILRSEAIKVYGAPKVASFSSRGPNYLDFNISKPDVTAPGVEIIAAYSPVVSIGSLRGGRRANYAILSGTSMACPHAAAVAAYVKTFHPSWSPSFIKSAIMTTAWPMNASNSDDREFGYGSGHINPLKAIDPGLVYPFPPEDYVKLLCRSIDNIRNITGDNTTTCPKDRQKIPPEEYNFPSLTVRVRTDRPFSVIFKRTVINVGFANSTYSARVVSSDSRLEIDVYPKVLSFKSLNESKIFTVNVTGGILRTPNIGLFSSLVWSDGTHVVRSPIVVHTTLHPL